MILKRKNVINKISLIIVSLLFSSCISDFDKKHNYESIIYNLVDASFTDTRRLLTPSMDVFSTKEKEDMFYKRLDSLQNIELPPVKVVIKDELGTLIFNESIERLLKSRFDSSESEIVQKKMTLDLVEMSNEKYDFVFKSKFSKDDKINYQKNNPGVLLGMYEFSEIYYNKTYSTYFFTLSLSNGKLNGMSFIVFIKKDENGMEIQDIIELSIS